MKKTLLLLIILFCVTYFYAQNNTNPNNNPKCTKDYFNQAELVVECSFIKVVANCNTRGTREPLHNLALVEYRVRRVYKGDQSLAGSIVYIIENGWNLGVENCSYIDTEGFIYTIFSSEKWYS